MEENKGPPLESELAAAMAEFDMEEDSKHEPFVKRFDTPDEIVQYWEHQLEKVREWTDGLNLRYKIDYFSLGSFDLVSFP